VDVDLGEAPARSFAEAARPAPGRPGGAGWFHYRRLPDGSAYLRWGGVAEFLVSPDGRRVACHRRRGATPEAFLAYLLGPVLSFALIGRGAEPLHATCVVVDGRAVAFLGDGGAGKSTLGAAFLEAGHALLTDDLLVATPRGAGVLACPGIPRIKLFPRVARRLLPHLAAGTPMNRFTGKRVIPLGGDGRRFSRRAMPLEALYVLAPPSERAGSGRIAIRPLSPRRAFVELVRNTFNTLVVEPARLERQLDLAAGLASRVPVRSLSIPRSLVRLPEVREAIRADLGG
jgi:hypothetical protein